jgi:3-deoxy-D-manno-octulosonic-acid transferase
MTLVIDLVYVALGLIAIPISLLRGRIARTTDHLRRRLFNSPPDREGGRKCLWIHGVSVGEVMTVRRLVERLEEALDDWDIVLSSSTAAGVEAARKLYERHTVISCPLDLGFAVRRAFDRVRPDAIAIIEHDFWPNLLRYAEAREVPVAIVNAHLSEKSLAGYRRLSMLYRWPPQSLTEICVQDEASAAGFRQLGFDEERIAICGNLKFDNLPPDAGELRAEIGFDDDDWVLVAGSTHEGEEDAALDALAKLRESDERTFLILVPRRIERVESIERLIDARGYSHARWSVARTKGPDVLLVDTIGDLAKLCAAGDTVFVGGTITPVGGHNVIEPASFAKPIVIGSCYRSQKSIVGTFLESEALIVVEDTAELVRRIVELKSDRALATQLGRRAAEVVERNRGSGDATLSALSRMLSR